MALVTIAKLHDVALANVVRMNFEARDIPVHLASEGFASLFGAGSSFTAIRLQVPSDWEAAARVAYTELMEDLDLASD